MTKTPNYKVFTPAPQLEQTIEALTHFPSLSLQTTRDGDLFITKRNLPPEPGVHEWARWCNARLSYESKRQYLYEIALFLNFFDERHESYRHLNDLHFRLYQTWRMSPGGGLTSEASWAKAAAILKNFYEFQVARGYMRCLPYTVIQGKTSFDAKATPQARFSTALTDTEWERFLHEGLTGSKSEGKRAPRWPARDRAGAISLLTTGMRIGELSKLTIVDFNATVAAEGLLQIGKITKGERFRVIEFPPVAIDAIRLYASTERRWQIANALSSPEYREKQQESFIIETARADRIEGTLHGERWKGKLHNLPRRLRKNAQLRSSNGSLEPASLFLGGSTGTALSPRGWHKLFSRANSRIILRDPDWRPVTPHDLRRTFASNLVDEVIEKNSAITNATDVSIAQTLRRDPVSVAQRALGHASPATTQRYLDTTYRIPRALSELLDHTSEDTTDE